MRFTMRLFHIAVCLLLLVFTRAIQEEEADIVYEYEDIEDGYNTDIPPDSTDIPPDSTDIPPDSTDDNTDVPPDSTDSQPTASPPDDSHSKILLKGITLADYVKNNTGSDIQMSIANYMTQYCATNPASCSESNVISTANYLWSNHPVLRKLFKTFIMVGPFNLNISPDHVTISEEVETNDGVMVTFYISLDNPDTGATIQLDREAVDMMLNQYSSQIGNDIGVEVVVQTAPGPPTTPPPGGLEDWEIALIVIGSVLGVAIIAAIIVFAVKRSGNSSNSGYSHESSPDRYASPSDEYDKLTSNRDSRTSDSYGGTSSFMYDNPTFTVEDDKKEIQENARNAVNENVYTELEHSSRPKSSYQESFTQL